MKPANIERQAQENLIRLAKAWCEATGESLSAAGRQAVGDSRFFANLIERYEAGEREPGDRKGSITVRVIDETATWFCDPTNWPNGHKTTVNSLVRELTDLSFQR